MSSNNVVIVVWFLGGIVFAIDSWTTRDRERELRSFWMSVLFLLVAVLLAVILN